MKGVIFGEVIRASENLCYVHTVLTKEAEGGEGVGEGRRTRKRFHYVRVFSQVSPALRCGYDSNEDKICFCICKIFPKI